jgi:hypothetical protein
MGAAMTPREIAKHRLENQQIAGSRCKEPGELVAWLGAVQAQDYLGALWTIGLRLPAATEARVEKAVADRTIVRTWPMRGTLHFVAAGDVRWMLELMTPRIIAGAARRHRELELDGASLGRIRKLLVRALQGGRQLTRSQIFQLLRRARISPDGQRGYHIMWRLAQEGVVCFGARAGKQQTFALLDEWVPHARSLERGEALAELARRYFASHGPATLHDFAWWSGLKVSDARAGLDMISSELSRESVEGKVYWLSEKMSPPSRNAPPAHLLPGFDEYLLGYTDRSAALDPDHARKIVPGNGMFASTIVSNGRVTGTWKRAFKKKRATLTASYFAPPKKAETRALAAAAERYGSFLEMPVDLCVVPQPPVTV